ncbi:2-C-methyl-D-erythritol 4-phosphate cytidylyltransferase [Rhodococcus sp. X156]|uniref:2-C-methyl-D-erythritol 4-phosphate cytidylyltransferase n=1 Tax=Rhodococcus sp. X156 TaxID=2499145 RepID=UPI000FD987A7|nr:2-C-methyl-D-erythritol 4-phosphate cytidylyltransferase [Rhodococcus sp. X156]
MGEVVAVVPAAGLGLRLGSDVPKAFVQLAGKTLLRRSVDVLLGVDGLALVVIVVAPGLVSEVAEQYADEATLVVAGGAERSESVRAGLAAAVQAVPGARYVLVHDAARALAPVELACDVVNALRAGAVAVVPALPVADTIKVVDAAGLVTATPERATLRAVQTPQGFHVDVLRTAHAQQLIATDDAALVERGGSPVHTVPGHPLAFKITTPLDLRLAQALLAEQ